MKMDHESGQYRIRRKGLLPLLEMGVRFFRPFCLKFYAGLIRLAFGPEEAKRRRMPGSDAEI
ncbi:MULTISPECIES: hypothetical protein [Methanoculleus]|jgi:hypothetical protein|uniref:Uncharacterized protein n=2 Tax=Methanoculleus thermophilus TaxID=2200 RepID=A0A1G8WMU9_9EURY|nr:MULTISPECIES: hypothetical protein [Methanoculleus]SDJ79407.1 hypothetical protein SAMN04488571_1019 [Methanoculleus thermophilus]HQD26032.1 hypothetical protein [Methanoculleus thermophilus]